MFVFIFYLGKRNSKGEKLITLALVTTPTTNPQLMKNTYHNPQISANTYKSQ